MKLFQISTESAAVAAYLAAVVWFSFAATLFFRLRIADAWLAVRAARRTAYRGPVKHDRRRGGKQEPFIIRERKLIVHTEETVQ